MSIKKNIVKDALVEAKQIEKFAYDSAKKALEESLAPQIEQALANTLKEIENSSEEENEIKENEIVAEQINEEITVNTDSDGTVNISISPDNSNELQNNPTEINSEPEMTHEQDEIYEIEGMGAIDAPAPAPTDVPPTDAPVEAEPSISDIDTKLADMAGKIDSILNAINSEQNPEGQVDVIDDETAQSAAPTAPAPAPQPSQDGVVSEDDMMFEIDEDFMNALSEMNSSDITEENISLSEMDDLDEIEIVSEEDEELLDDETMEEMRGVGHTVQRSAPNRQNFIKNKNTHSSISMNEDVEKIKVQYESTIDELIQENTSLKQAVGEYKQNIQEFGESFVQLQKQINGMHLFNGKLAYANRLLNKGGLTNNEKIKIAEAFDKADSLEEAKKLYTNFLNEMKSSNGVAIQSTEVKTAKPSVIQSTPINTQTETIFESVERKRMKQLAGL